MRALELQDQFARTVYLPIREKWDSIDLHYENVVIDGIPYEIFQAVFIVDSVRKDFTPSLDCLDALTELQRNQPEGQEEKWTWLEFRMNSAGQYKFDFKYGIPPLAAEQMKFARSASDD
ncbi:MAG: hypothetical protein JF586_05180 [Burkholderiales bacterium]|jgi:hypothetical protein|nr:hypothetical protein [Burkholderiales bacterium]